MGLSSKERMKMAMDHEEPDRVPYHATFVPEMREILREKYKNELPNGGEKRRYNDIDPLDILLGHDMLQLSYGIATGYYMDTDSDIYTDRWGIKWKKVYYKTNNGVGYYTEIIEHPLADDSKIEDYIPPDPDTEDMHYAEEMIEKYGKDYYVCGLVDCSIFEALKYLRGFAQSFVDLAVNKDIANKIMDLSIEYHLKLGLELIERGVDMLFIADDIAGENSLLMSPDTFREMIKPRMGYFIGQLKKKNRDIKVVFHSDGNLELIMDDLIEVGIDLLNPIQPESMDPAKVKKRYGKDIALWGTISTQRTLPFGSPEDVEKEVMERIRTCGPGGGFLIAPTHNFQLDVPVENIEAFYRTVKKYGKYPVKL